MIYFDVCVNKIRHAALYFTSIIIRVTVLHDVA